MARAAQRPDGVGGPWDAGNGPVPGRGKGDWDAWEGQGGRKLQATAPWQGNLVEVLGREVRQGSPGELMLESTPSRQRRPPCKTNKEKSDEAADTAALTYLLIRLREVLISCIGSGKDQVKSFSA